MVPQVVAHIHLFNLPILLLQLREHLLRKTRRNSAELLVPQGINPSFANPHLEEVIIVFLHLHVAHVTWRRAQGEIGVACWGLSALPPKPSPSLTVRSVCGLGGVLWIPVQVEQHYGLNRI